MPQILMLILLPLLPSCIEPHQVAGEPLAPYKQSLLPPFQSDIASLGEIPRYRIAVRLDADTLTLTGRQLIARMSPGQPTNEDNLLQ